METNPENEVEEKEAAQRRSTKIQRQYTRMRTSVLNKAPQPSRLSYLLENEIEGNLEVRFEEEEEGEEVKGEQEEEIKGDQEEEGASGNRNSASNKLFKERI